MEEMIVLMNSSKLAGGWMVPPVRNIADGGQGGFSELL